MHQIPIGKLERELERISLFHERLQYEQQKQDKKVKVKYLYLNKYE